MISAIKKSNYKNSINLKMVKLILSIYKYIYNPQKETDKKLKDI